MKKIIEELKKRLKKLKDEEKIFVVYHFDVDGCVSASIMWRLLKDFGVMCEFSPVTRGFEQIAMDRVKRANPSKVILVDYTPDHDFQKFLEQYKTEIIDHHVREKQFEEFEYFTSADYEGIFSISYLLCIAAQELGIENIKWMGYVGAFWDKCVEGTEFFKEGIYKEDMDKMFPFNLLVSFSQTKGSEKLLQILNESSTFEIAEEKIKENPDYLRARELFEKELKEIKFSRKYFSDIKLNIFWIKTIFKHIRIYVDYITYTTPGTHIFVLDEHTRFKLSFRTSLEINLLNIVREMSTENKDFGGGGHPKACGAMLKNHNIEEFLTRFIEKYRKILES